MLKTLIITNSREISVSLARYLNYRNFVNSEVSVYTFNDLRIIPREILEMDFVVSEVYRLERISIGDYGLDIFLSFIRMGKKGILMHIDKIRNSERRIQEFLFKLPGEMKELVGKINNLKSKEKIELSEEDVKLLKDWFPYRVVKDHHHGRHG